MSTSITDYVCNLIAGRSQITNLYYAVDQAKVQQSRCLQFCYKVSFKGIGTKMYKGPELVRLENKSLSCSLAQLEIQLNLAGQLTLDQFIVFLLYARNTIQNLYQMRNNALYMHSAIKVFCYTFVNPFGELAQVSSNKLSFKSARSFSTFFDTCLCNSKNFDPTKIISGQLSGTLQKIIFGDQPNLAPGLLNSISLSSDGNTLAVGENGFPSFGRVQVYTRNGSSWSLQASLTGSGSIGPSNQGRSTSLSSDGNTLAVGGYNDDGGIGATWIFVRSGGSWSEQAKLVGSSVIGLTSNQGSSVSLSSNGNTLAVGGVGDDSGFGATWVFVRSGSSWSEQTKLVGTGNIGTSEQGTSVSLSDNGNTLAVGGQYDNTDFGATWIFTRSGSVWTQQTKISGPAASAFGKSVSLSADGNIIAIGAQTDDSNIGSTYIYNRTGNTWNQEVKLVGTNSVGPNPNQGFSVSLSGSGSLVAVGGPSDGLNNEGKAWIFQKKNGVWTQIYLLENPVAPNPPLSGNLFGQTLGLSKNGTTLAIAGPSYNNYAGFVAIYV